MHLKLLRASSQLLNKKRAELKRSLADAEARIKQLKVSRMRELQVAASTFLVNRELEKISGIGKTLKQRILQQCFEGTLSSLNRVDHVHGIGREKADAVRLWINNAIKRLPGIIQGEFKGKGEIMRKFDKLESNITSQTSLFMRELQEKDELSARIDKEVGRLSLVRSSTFRRALRGDSKAVSQVSQFMGGTFPEWEEMPNWFRNAMKVLS